MAAEVTAPAPLAAAIETLRHDLDWVDVGRVEHDAGSDTADVIRSASALLAALDADPYRKCDCGKPRLPGPCSGSCDNDA